MDTTQNIVDSAWEPACGGTEVPFTMRGKQYLYMWNRFLGMHSHYCITDDLFLSVEEWLQRLEG